MPWMTSGTHCSTVCTSYINVDQIIVFNKKLNKLVYVAMLVTIYLDLSFLLFL